METIKEISLAKPQAASTQLSAPCNGSLTKLEGLAKRYAIIPLLAKLGVRRHAKLDEADYSVLADDLAKYELGDIGGGLDDIAKYPRREGETAFPELPRLKRAIVERKLVREAAEIKAQEAREFEERKAIWEREREEDRLTGRQPTELEKRLDAVLAAARTKR